MRLACARLDDFRTGSIILFCLYAITGHPGAWASDASNQEISGLALAQPSLPDALKQIADQGGLRSQLEELGVRFIFTYYGDTLGNPSGGMQQGLRYDGRFGAIIDADLDKLVGWSGGTFHASIHEIQGAGLSAKNIENLMTVSSIEEPATTRLFNLWVEQKLGNDASLRVGQITAAQEFLVSQNANLFVNTTFGWPLLPSQDLPSGGPAYPEATPGIRLKFTPSDQLTLLAAIFNGDPAGPGAGNPVKRDSNGLAFRVNDPPLLMAELGFAYNQGSSASLGKNPNQEGSGAATSAQQSPVADSTGTGLPGSVKLGAWVYTGSALDRPFNSEGGVLAGLGEPGAPKAGNFAIYGVIDQALWRTDGPAGDRGLNIFLRASAAPGGRNLIDFYLDTGLTFKGPIGSRPDDIVGIGFAFGHISPQALAREEIAAAGTAISTFPYEAAIELTYQWQIAQNWSLQPDFQYIIHPGGQVLNPLDSGGAPIQNATVIGIRTIVKF